MIAALTALTAALIAIAMSAAIAALTALTAALIAIAMSAAVSAVSAAIAALIAIAMSAAVSAVSAAIIAIAIALGAPHHRRGAVFMSIDPDREIAKNILIEPFEAFNFVDRRRRRIDVHQREMRLPILAQAVGERLDAPIFGLLDRPA